jgi:hypothetical protein
VEGKDAEERESEDEALDLPEGISCPRFIILLGLSESAKSSEDESELASTLKGTCLSGAFPLSGDGSMTDCEAGEPGKAERMLFDMDCRGSAEVDFFGAAALRANSTSLLQTPKKSVKALVALMSLMRVGRSSLNRTPIIANSSSYRWFRVS